MPTILAPVWQVHAIGPFPVMPIVAVIPCVSVVGWRRDVERKKKTRPVGRAPRGVDLYPVMYSGGIPGKGMTDTAVW